MRSVEASMKIPCYSSLASGLISTLQRHSPWDADSLSRVIQLYFLWLKETWGGLLNLKNLFVICFSKYSVFAFWRIFLTLKCHSNLVSKSLPQYSPYRIPGKDLNWKYEHATTVAKKFQVTHVSESNGEKWQASNFPVGGDVSELKLKKQNLRHVSTQHRI